MCRGVWVGLVLVGLTAGAARADDDPPAGHQLIGLLVAGDQTGVTTGRVTWTTAPSDIRAVAVAHVVSAGASPLASGWVQLALAGKSLPVPDGSAEAVGADLSVGSTVVFGGSIPAGLTVPGLPNIADLPAAGPTSGGMPAGATSPTGLPLLGVEVTPPADGEMGLAKFTLWDADGQKLSGSSISIPDGGWWALGLSPGDPATVPTPGGTGGVVVEVGGETPQTGGPTPTPTPTPTVGTPEPGTLALAGIGIAGLAGWRLRRRRK